MAGSAPPLTIPSLPWYWTERPILCFSRSLSLSALSALSALYYYYAMYMLTCAQFWCRAMYERSVAVLPRVWSLRSRMSFMVRGSMLDAKLIEGLEVWGPTQPNLAQPSPCFALSILLASHSRVCCPFYFPFDMSDIFLWFFSCVGCFTLSLFLSFLFPLFFFLSFLLK